MSSSSLQGSLAVALLTLSGCSADLAADLEEAPQPIVNPTSSTLPPSQAYVALNWDDITNECHATLVSERWAVMAAHCFRNLSPAGTAATLSFAPPINAEIHGGGSHVRFHPKTWFDGKETWETAYDSTSALTRAYDIALVQLDSPSSASVAKLYHPASTPSLTGSVKFGGNGGTGQAGILGLIDDPLLGGKVLTTNWGSPSTGEGGDSGTGALFTLTGGMPASVPFPTSCAPVPASSGEVLVGVYNAGGQQKDIWVPVYLPDLSEWIAKTIGETDGDGICDEKDNCPSVKNADQANCNKLAETASSWGGDGEEIGDACDTAPCPDPSLKDRVFVPETSLYLFDVGRYVADDLALKPILGKGAPVSGSAHPKFCLCRDGTTGAAHSSSETCKAGPFYCTLSPANTFSGVQETGNSGVPTSLQTYWHKISIDYGSPIGIQKGNVIDVTYPGSGVVNRWAYATDNTYWTTTMGWFTPVPAEPAYGLGTDLGGVLWARDSTIAVATAGAADHGLPSPGFCDNSIESCTITDGFAYGVAPDYKGIKSNGMEPPVAGPAPPFSYCPECYGDFKFPGERVSNPAALVTVEPSTREATVWMANGGRSATSALSADLRSSMADTSTRWVPASEPMALTNSPSAARAVLVRADGVAVLNAFSVSEAGFGVAAVSGGSSTMTPRSRFAATWSRSTETLHILGGIDSHDVVLANAWTWRPTLGWSSVSLDPAVAPRNVQAATFSHRDWRVWVVDDRSTTNRRLMRFNPATGEAVTDTTLSALNDLTTLWMTTLEDGRVIVAGTNGTVYRLLLLNVAAFAPGAVVQVDGTYEAAGNIRVGPTVRRGLITVGLEQPGVGGRIKIAPVAVTAADFL